MSPLDYSSMFSCPKCGAVGAIFLVKVAGTQVVIKQKCPTHGGRAMKLPLLRKDLYMPYVRQSVFKCIKCGQDAVPNIIKTSGPWTIIKCTCPTHGDKMPNYKIWSIIYNEITSMPDTTAPAAAAATEQAQPTQPQLEQPTSGDDNKFCSNCGTQIEGTGRFCGNCGSEID